MAVRIRIQRNSFPFHPQVLNLREKSLNGLTISQLSNRTAITKIQGVDNKVEPEYTIDVYPIQNNALAGIGRPHKILEVFLNGENNGTAYQSAA